MSFTSEFYRTLSKVDQIVNNSHDAQPCYCGELNCVGFLGGKTQTDIGGMDDLYLDGTFFTFQTSPFTPYLGFAALGITDEVEKLGLKGNRKKKGKKLDEDYMVPSRALIPNHVSY